MSKHPTSRKFVDSTCDVCFKQIGINGRVLKTTIENDRYKLEVHTYYVCFHCMRSLDELIRIGISAMRENRKELPPPNHPSANVVPFRTPTTFDEDAYENIDEEPS